ncbi:MAG: hypothetical protein HYX90_12030 [Chloroflexi bacterium]|nr:hypothetical protein [Chloroflexota bacterium]
MVIKETFADLQSVDEGLLARIDAVQLSPRLSKERVDFFEHELEVTADRSVLAMESWRKTEGEALDVRWAKLVQKWAERLPIVIFDNQLIAGNGTKLFRGADPWVEYEAPNLVEVMESGKKEIRQSAARLSKCADEEWEAVEEAVNFFLADSPVQAIFNAVRGLYGDWADDFEKARGFQLPGRINNVAPIPQWDKLLSRGLCDVIGRAEAGIEKVRSGAEPDAKKAWFWQATIICCRAVIEYARRYARLARDMSSVTADPVRKKELENIAESCERVPEFPARTLHEASQSRIIFGIAMNWCRPNVVADESGRLDQYLYPFLIADLQNRKVTVEEAADLVGTLLSNVSRRDGIKSKPRGQQAQGTLISNVVLGGLTQQGAEASNELTYLVLHMAGLLRYAEPHYTMRVSEKTPKWVMMKALETNRKVGGGQPQFMSDQRIIDHFVRLGESLEDARDWMAHACMNPVAGGTRGSRIQMRNAGHPNMPLLVDLALHDGVSVITGKRVGAPTGDPRSFKSFNDLWEAYRRQVEFMVPRLNVIVYSAQRVDEEKSRFPLWSILAPGCLEKGQDFLTGGLWSYRTWEWKDRGHVDVADSLMAIKKLVFDDKKLTMAEMVDALDSNFAGERGEEIRRMCLAAPKFGNGIEEADRLVRDSGKLIGDLVQGLKNPFGGPYCNTRDGLSWHYFGGKGVGALPNGRRSAEPLNDGSLSPMRGMDKKGVTGVLRSALVAGFEECTAAVLNQKFPTTLMQSTQSMEKLVDLTKTFLTSGGSHIQYNMLDRQTLLDAKKHPELYKDLVVRVAGYSAYWVHLTPEIQDDVISRTEQAL